MSGISHPTLTVDGGLSDTKVYFHTIEETPFLHFPGLSPEVTDDPLGISFFLGPLFVITHLLKYVLNYIPSLH